MSNTLPTIKYLEKEIMEEMAISRVHNVSAKFGHTYPFEIESFLWKEYGYKIVPSAGLEKGCEVDTALICCKKIIRIEERIYNKQYNRARFSLAHELAHLILHSDYINFVMQKLQNASKTDEYKAIIQSLSVKESNRAEMQAHYLGGAILAPKPSLLVKLNEVLKSNDWGSNEYLDDGQKDLIYKQLCEYFGITKTVVIKRLDLTNLDYLLETPVAELKTFCE